MATVTKDDVFALRSQVQADLFAIKNELAPIKADITLIKWMLGLLLGGVAALILKSFF